MNHFNSRRRFLASALTLAGQQSLPLLAGLGAAANASAADDYKALICIFLNGGNDAYNTVLACDPDSWRQYQRYRASGASPIALGASEALRLSPVTAQAGREFTLHPALGALKKMFDDGRAAIVANVGPLVQPTSATAFRNGTAVLPRELFSHNDQQSVWQSSKPEGAAYGWGGRIADMVAAGNSNNMFTCISTAENAVFVSGRTLTQYQLAPAGVTAIRPMTTTLFGAHNHPLANIITAPSNNLIAREYAATTRRAMEAQAYLSSAMAASGSGGIPEPSLYPHPVTGVATVNPLAVQLQTVARVIAGRSSLGVRRQVFYLSLGGFDTHADQIARHGDLMARLAHALSYFDKLSGNIMGTNMREQLTMFTASDFGRTLVTNGDGTDHGWGGHHIVAGGAVRGRDIYGAFPAIGLGHEQEVGRGALLPSISVEQYGATMAKWFGLSASQLRDVFPNIGNFSQSNLGFMS